jgi:hypothetical protein
MPLLTITVLVSALLAGGSVLFHYECLCLLNRVVNFLGSHRRRLLVTMIGLLLAHVVEIWFYAGAYALLSSYPAFGSIYAVLGGDSSFLDLAYYSGMVYTTVGFGDMLPSGGLRLITATEALVGLSLITWSASFAFFQMQALFGKRDS